MRATITRVSTDDVIGTFGTVKWDHKPAPFAVACEDPWLDNEAWVSCIPPGYYVCRRVDSPHFGDTFEITEVPGRSHILFHRGNTHHNTNGCILIGESFHFLDGIPSIRASGEGYAEFMREVRGLDEFELRIVFAL
jgi:hypothetical protein